MSLTKRIAFGAAASWFNRGVTILLGLVLMPVLFRHLPKEELGIWLLLGQSWAAMGILDLGMGVTLTRRIALAKGKSGGDPNAPLTEESKQEIADLVACGHRIYRFMAIGVFVVACGLGFIYLRNLHLDTLSSGTAWLAWTILCAAQAFTVWGTVWTCLLQGVGYVGWDAIIASFVSAATLAIQIIAVLCGGGLVALAAISTIGAIVQRYLTRWLARRRKPELFALKGSWNTKVLKGMRNLAFRAWLTAMGTMLVFNTDQFFIASSAGVAGVPSFRAAYIFVHNLTVLAVTIGLASTVFISHLWQAGNIAQVHRLVERNTRLALLIMLCGCAVAICAGQSLFNLWLGPGNFVGYTIVTIFFIYETLEAQSYVISTSSRATEDEAFGWSSLIAGITKIILATIFVRKLGVLGIAVSTLLALVLTNHWYMVYRGLKRLELPLGAYLKMTLFPSLAWFVLAFLFGHLTSSALRGGSDLLQLLGTLTSVGIVFAAAVVFSVLSPHERRHVRAKIFAQSPSATIH